MTFGQIFVFAAFAVFALGTWASVLFVIPFTTRSLFRYKLWAIRDELVDSAFSGELPLSPPVTDTIRRVERMIRFAPHLTVPNIIAAGVLYRTELNENTHAGEDWQSLTTSARQRVEQAELDAGKAAIRYAVLGRPSGWLSLLVFFPTWAVLHLRGRIGKHRATKRLSQLELNLGHDITHRVGRGRGFLSDDDDSNRPLSAFAG